MNNFTIDFPEKYEINNSSIQQREGSPIRERDQFGDYGRGSRFDSRDERASQTRAIFDIAAKNDIYGFTRELKQLAYLFEDSDIADAVMPLLDDFLSAADATVIF